MNVEPIYPMEPTSSPKVPNGDQWVAQIKWDGVRILTYYDGDNVELFNRKKNKRTYHFPELTKWNYFDAASAILDGEVIAMGKDGLPSFHEVMRRDGLRNLSKVPAVMQSVPITYMVFDVLYLNGSWVHERPFEERMGLLKDHLLPHPHVKLVETQEDGDALFHTIQKFGMEGVVVKDRHSSYVFDAKKPIWQKVKIVRDVNAVIGGYTSKLGVANALLVGLYDDQGHLWYIGHVGTGKLTKGEWRNVTKSLEGIQQEQSPFSNQIGRKNDAFWVKPEQVAKIHFAEWTSGRSLRQPSIQSFLDVDPKSCTFKNEASDIRQG
jgi:bifunctional non-homologous end joining protein LigD